jgi:hypothetical protein
MPPQIYLINGGSSENLRHDYEQRRTRRVTERPLRNARSVVQVHAGSTACAGGGVYRQP